MIGCAGCDGCPCERGALAGLGCPDCIGCASCASCGGPPSRSLDGIGCTRLGAEVLTTLAGPVEIQYVAVDSPADLLRMLQRRAGEDAGDPLVRDLALRIARAYPGKGATGRAIHAFVQRTIRYVRELRETFQASRYTLQVQAGDCDDHAVLVAALAVAAGLDAALVPLPNDSAPTHVVAQLRDDAGEWQWAETTIAAEWGEHPVAAARRLRADRADIGE